MFTISPDPSVDSADLGNGLHATPFISGYVDVPYQTVGEPIQLDAWSDWENISRQFTGQYGGADIMHESEYLGCGMAEKIAATPGEYAMPPVWYYCEEHDEYDPECGDCIDPVCGGWLMLFKELD